MPTPLYSVYIREVFPRAIVLNLSAMGAVPSQEDLTYDFGLQLLLEAHHQAGLKPALTEVAAVFNDLYRDMFPCSLTLPANDPAVEFIVSSRKYEGRKLLNSTSSGGQVEFELERNYQAFCNAAQHYIYYIESIETYHASEPDAETAEEDAKSVTLAIAGRFPWLFGSLRPGMFWESTAFPFAMYA